VWEIGCGSTLCTRNKFRCKSNLRLDLCNFIDVRIKSQKGPLKIVLTMLKEQTFHLSAPSSNCSSPLFFLLAWRRRVILTAFRSAAFQVRQEIARETLCIFQRHFLVCQLFACDKPRPWEPTKFTNFDNQYPSRATRLRCRTARFLSSALCVCCMLLLSAVTGINMNGGAENTTRLMKWISKVKVPLNFHQSRARFIYSSMHARPLAK